MPFVSLLKEWSELEPEKCSYVGEMFAIRGWTLANASDVSERLTNAEIQCAIQEAIESHGWFWFLGRVRIDEGVYFKCRIALAPEALPEDQPAPRLTTFLSTHSTSHVLLQAYLEALNLTHEIRQDIDAVVPEEADDVETAENNVETNPETEVDEKQPDQLDAVI